LQLLKKFFLWYVRDSLGVAGSGYDGHQNIRHVKRMGYKAEAERSILLGPPRTRPLSPTEQSNNICPLIA
jgi:hypothetical protein